ncbi:MAG: hypothetical protein FWG44_08455 [Oscillospiraceae bacterium]|nr:hypothetical protein [Oscillospiraceae bacterium]
MGCFIIFMILLFLGCLANEMYFFAILIVVGVIIYIVAMNWIENKHGYSGGGYSGGNDRANRIANLTLNGASCGNCTNRTDSCTYELMQRGVCGLYKGPYDV